LAKQVVRPLEGERNHLFWPFLFDEEKLNISKKSYTCSGFSRFFLSSSFEISFFLVDVVNNLSGAAKCSGKKRTEKGSRIPQKPLGLCSVNIGKPGGGDEQEEPSTRSELDI
jgi:hypothetical protein